jgi:hypothetical protein
MFSTMPLPIWNRSMLRLLQSGTILFRGARGFIGLLKAWDNWQAVEIAAMWDFLHSCQAGKSANRCRASGNGRRAVWAAILPPNP